MSGLSWIKLIPGYHYHDSPEGEDCLKKVIFVNKMGLFFGGLAGTIDCVTMSKPVGIWNILGRYALCTGPILAVGSSWAASTCILTTLRGKDDPFNYLFGGVVAGSVVGAIAKSGPVGYLFAIVFGLIGHGKKEAERHGLTLFSDPNTPHPREFSGIWLRYYDYTYLEDKPRGWKKFADEKL